jgi:DNA polymerase
MTTRRQADPAIGLIENRADGSNDLEALAVAARSCTACAELAAHRTTVVVGDTPPRARLVIVGEAPGVNEDVVGRPFVGKAGQLLDGLLGEAGLSRADTAVLNVVKCRPPANRTPTRAEASRCAGWLDRQIALIDPPLVLALGRTALNWSLGAAPTLESVRQRVHDWRGRRLVVSYHPSAAIRFGPRGTPRMALEADLRVVAAELACG